jgi:hypothetical protein
MVTAKRRPSRGGASGIDLATKLIDPTNNRNQFALQALRAELILGLDECRLFDRRLAKARPSTEAGFCIFEPAP